MNLFHEVDLAGSTATGRLFLHSMPGRYETIPEFLEQYESEEVYGMLCLTPDEEIREKSPGYLKLLSDPEFAKNVLQAPITDYGTPSDLKTFRGFLEILVAALNKGRNLLIHSAAGVGRTGMAAICLLMDLGLEMKEARKRVYEAHSEPETHEQWKFIKNSSARPSEEEEE